jgi:phosphonoacetaldehyde hydrolase
MSERIRLVIFDWAGTTVDHGCVAPVAPFVEVLRRQGVAISDADARGPMGLDKKEHLRALLALPDADRQWRDMHGHGPTSQDIERIYLDMVPLALASVAAHSGLIAGLTNVVEELRGRGIKIGATTGYFREMADVCYETAAKEGYRPDFSVCASDVPRGRPAPWMVYRNMEGLGIFPSAAVLKVGDTAPDIGEALNAGCWSAGVAATGSDVGLTEAQLAALGTADRKRRLEEARDKLLDAGAHDVVDSIRDVPRLVEEIDARLAAGDRP